MAATDNDNLRKRFARQWLAIAIVLLVIVLGGYAAVRQQQASERASSAAAPDDADLLLKDATIPVEGMSCGACAASIKRTLAGLDGVADVHVNLVERNVQVSYAEGTVTPEHLVAAINELGYKAATPARVELAANEAAAANVGEGQVTSVTIPVEGMACEFCVETLVGELKQIDGVQDVRVRLAEKEARIDYVDGIVTPERLVAAINDLGFKAQRPTTEGDE